MGKKVQKSYLGRGLAFLLSLAVSVSGISYVPAAKMTAEAADHPIEISNAEELGKIGNDSSYPMDGDYVLTSDIDLSGENWTPIGGATGPEYGLTSGDRVFSGTFDGQGHSIEGLTIAYDGSSSSQKTNQSGLFAMIGSDSVSDYAEVKNLNFTDVSITHSLGGGDTIGALSGDADGYVKIDNIAVLSGSITVNGTSGGDLIGVGGVVGQVRRNNSAVQMSNLYNAASVTVASSVNTSPMRCGGILGRIHQDALIGSLRSCLNVGKVTWKGGSGYAINGYSASTGAASNTGNISNCYYLEGTGNDFGASTEITESQLSSQEIVNALGADYWEIYNGTIMPVISQGKVVAQIPSPVFAEGDSISSVTQSFTLPLSYIPETSEESITWSSSDLRVISINGATAVVYGVLADTKVTLTATTESGRTKTFDVTVVSNLSLSLDQEYAKVGTPITASVENVPAGESFTYQWTIDGAVVSSTASYTPKTSDLNKFLTITASLTGAQNAQLVKKIYCSKLPVVYIDTNDGYGITSKTVYKDATMHIQGNDLFNSENTTLYDGGISIRGRGNSTWNTSFSKLPYKIKLDTKTNLFGFGTSKHWTLLANYMDESLIRNTSAYDLSGQMGMMYLKSTHVDVILNGVYAGNYQFVGNVRIEESRADIYDWEELAEDVAKAIGKAEGISGDARDALEEYLNQNMGWITSDSVTYNGKTYKISDYFTDIPKNEDGSINVSGGFLFELDEYYDEYSKFRTASGQPIMFKSPEFVSTNSDLLGYAQKYIQAVEDSVRASDFYVTVTKQENTANTSEFTEDYEGRQHYTDLVDMDSLVNYFVLNEFYWNTETMKKSTYMYKDLDGKLYIGPVWDMDWTSNSQVSAGETNYPTQWMTNTRNSGAQAEQWYKYLIRDPYFVTKAYECYQENRQNFEDIVKTGGVIDQEQEYLAESAQANYEAGYLMHRSTFTTETERLRTFLKARLAWMDQQFTSVDTLLSSLGKYSASGSIKVTADTSNKTTTTYTATVTNSSVSKVGFYINGILEGTASVTNGTASFTSDDAGLEREEGKRNVIQVRGMDASGNLLSNGTISNYATFTKDIPAETLSGTVTISGTATAGSVLTAKVSDTNNSGTLSYQWYADGTAISGATSDTWMLTDAEVGKKIKVVITSSIETGSLESAETDAVTAQQELKNDHLIINQVYGGGANDGTPVSHSFIELYNPTEQEISLDGYSIGYLSGGKNGAAAEEVMLALDGTKSIPAYASYLIRCEAQDDSTPELITLSITVFDQEWSQTIDNKRYRLILYKGATVEDGVSVNEDAVEGAALEDGTISKQRAIRRKDFADTNDNQADFITVTYQAASEATVSENRPRSLADGSWGLGTDPNPDPDPVDPPAETKLEGTLSIRGNAIVGAVLYADEATNNSGTLSCQWYADGSPIAGATDLFYVVDQALAGKTVSVTIASTVETGTMSCQMASAVEEKEAQTGHLIIHQVYGCSTKDGAISHSFIELYNPTAETVSLKGYSIGYTSSDTTDSLALSGEIPANTSYLIRCAEGKAGSVLYTIESADAEWDLAISNKRYCIVLRNGEVQVDGVSVNEAEIEGTPLTDPEGDEIISKNKAIRRICFIDTDVNVDDFEVLNYSKLPESIFAAVIPKSTANGAWGQDAFKPVEPVIEELSGTLSIRGNAIVGAVLYADEATNNTGELSFQWYADGEPVSGATGQFYIADESCEGKKISVTITSSVETGSLSYQMDSEVATVAAQTEHLIINQAYGTGGKKEPALSHSFIELYNPTAEAVDLSGYTLWYTSDGVEDSYALSGEIPAYTSYLIRCAEGKAGSIYAIERADAEWDTLDISNKQYSIVLLNGETQVDGISVNEEPVEGTPLTDPEGDEIISKNKSVRRINFIDTDSNVDDFEVLNYTKITEEILKFAAPKSSADGVWGKELLPPEEPVITPDDPEETKQELSGTVSLAEAYTNADNYTAESWARLQAALLQAKEVLNDPASTKEQMQAALDSLSAALNGLEKVAHVVTPPVTPPSDEEPGNTVKTLAAPSITSVKSVIRSGNSNIAVKFGKVDGAAEYRIYRKVGSKTTLLGTTANAVYYDTNPVSGKASYLIEAVSGTVVSEASASVSITLPKATTKVTAKAVTVSGKKTVKVTWKRVKGATKYLIFRSTKSGSGYKRIAVVKKAANITYTDKKVVKGKKYYYRVVAVKKNVYSPSKKSKVVKVK